MCGSDFELVTYTLPQRISVGLVLVFVVSLVPQFRVFCNEFSCDSFLFRWQSVDFFLLAFLAAGAGLGTWMRYIDINSMLEKW